MNNEALDDAYERLKLTGPEFAGWLSNHGPMAAESLVRRGRDADVGPWLDRYVRRLERAPVPSGRIVDWRGALGDPRRLGDWTAWFGEELRERAWTEVLRIWWPRLVPGIAAGATHGVIRVGHAVRVLRQDGDAAPRVAELACGLGYWAARWQPVAKATAPDGALGAAAALASVPPVPDQSGGIRARLAQLDDLAGWGDAQAALAPRADAPGLLREIVIAAVRRYATHAHGNPVMMVHAATAPNAVLRVLPSLPAETWARSVAAAWSAAAAIHAAYAPRGAMTPREPAPSAADGFDRAARHGDEHVIKLADTALDVFEWTSDDAALAAITTAADLIGKA